ncbi:MAG: hypothetical protein AAGI28_09880 [Pseudomonadota bacterium]
MTSVKLSMQFGTSQFSAEGSEQFVNTMLERWTQIAKENVIPNIGSSKQAADQNDPASNGGDSAQQYENVFDEVDGGLKIIANIPGSNKADKTRGTALTLLFGNLLGGQSTTSADAIRDACVDQGCYDGSNFASHLKGLKEKVAMNTKAGGGYDVKLTAPGRKAAKEFVEQLNNGAA